MDSTLRRWRTALLAGLILGTVFGLIEGFSLFSVAFAKEFHAGRGASSSIFAIYLLVSTVLAPLAGATVDRFGPRRVVMWAFPGFAAGIAACVAVVALWQLYLIYGFLIAVSATLLITSAQVMVRGGYTESRGKAVGIAYACLGIGDFVLFSLLGQVVGGIGWRAGYLVAAVVALIAWLAFCVLTRPAGHSTEPGRHDDSAAVTTSSAARLPFAWKSFFFLLAAAFLGSVVDFVVFQHSAPFLVRSGYSESRAGLFLGLTALGYVAGQLAAGFLSDRSSRELVGSAGAVLCVAAVAALVALVHTWWAVMPVVLALGAGVGGVVGSVSAAVGDLFAGARLGRISGFVQLAGALGAAFGTSLGAVFFDLTGTYAVTFGIAAGCASAWIGTIWVAAPRRSRLVDRGQESSAPARAESS